VEAGTLLAELKRRRVFRALLGYGIVAFAVLQIVEPIVHGLHWPDSVVSYVVVALAIGFPVVVALAWIYDVNAGRIERTRAAPASTARAARLALASIITAVLTAVAVLLWTRVRQPDAGLKRIAILPFASLNAGDDVAYFADGIHSELLTQLAKVSDLEVISRTSVLQYRQGARNLREIAESLGVSSILEGSVQRSGDRVRIEAHLVDARHDRQLWAERYDRQMTDVFAIQTAVAEEDCPRPGRAALAGGEGAHRAPTDG
jgi:TolB-like protein